MTPAGPIPSPSLDRDLTTRRPVLFRDTIYPPDIDAWVDYLRLLLQWRDARRAAHTNCDDLDSFITGGYHAIQRLDRPV